MGAGRFGGGADGIAESGLTLRWRCRRVQDVIEPDSIIAMPLDSKCNMRTFGLGSVDIRGHQ